MVYGIWYTWYGDQLSSHSHRKTVMFLRSSVKAYTLPYVPYNRNRKPHDATMMEAEKFQITHFQLIARAYVRKMTCNGATLTHPVSGSFIGGEILIFEI
jgi:hypothetical protein